MGNILGVVQKEMPHAVANGRQTLMQRIVLMISDHDDEYARTLLIAWSAHQQHEMALHIYHKLAKSQPGNKHL